VFIYRLIQALIYALIGMVMATMFNAQLNYQQMLRLSIVSITTVKLVSTAMEIASVNIPFWWPICFGITMVYLALAVKANAGEFCTATEVHVYSPPPVIDRVGRPVF